MSKWPKQAIASCQDNPNPRPNLSYPAALDLADFRVANSKPVTPRRTPRDRSTIDAMKRAPFDELVAKYQRLVLDLIRKYYGGQLRHLEDDLSQEIWIKLWSAFKKSESQIDDFKSYLYRTVQTTLWDAIRMVEKRSAVGLDDLELAEPESDLDSRMELETRMKGLSDEENLMIRAHLRGYNYDEIATMLDVSEGRVRNLMTRIKKKMAWRVQ